MSLDDAGSGGPSGGRRLQGVDRRVLAAGVAVTAVLAAVPFVATPADTSLVLLGLVFVMLGVSWNLLAGYAGQISLGHAAFFGVGAFVSAWLTTPTRAGLPAAIETPALLSLVGGALVAALLALVVGPIMFRLRGHYFAVGTLALAAIVQLVMLDQRQFSGGATGYYVQGGAGELCLGSACGSVIYLVGLAATLATVAVTYWLVERPPGLGMRAVHDDEAAASSLGVYPLKYKMYAFVVSSFFAGLAGAVYAQDTLYVNPESTLGVGWTIDTLVVVILGGMGTMAGPLLGAVLFLIIDSVLSDFVGGLATTVEGALIILFVLFLPHGLYGLYGEGTPGGAALAAVGSTGSAGNGAPEETTGVEDDAGEDARAESGGRSADPPDGE